MFYVWDFFLKLQLSQITKDSWALCSGHSCCLQSFSMSEIRNDLDNIYMQKENRLMTMTVFLLSDLKEGANFAFLMWHLWRCPGDLPRFPLGLLEGLQHPFPPPPPPDPQLHLKYLWYLQRPSAFAFITYSFLPYFQWN